MSEQQTLLIELNNGEFLDSKIVRVEQNTTLRFACGREALGRQVRLNISVYDVEHTFPELARLSDLDNTFDLKCEQFGSFK